MANFSIKEVLGDSTPKVIVVDIGAMLEGKSRYDDLVERGMAQVIGFEPEPHEFQKLNTRADQRHAYLPYFVGNGRPGIFHRCRYNGCSSLYKPNAQLMDIFTAIDASQNGNFSVLDTTEVTTKRLDDIQEITACDFLKIDVQGAELDVLEGAVRTLSGTAVVELEVEFVPIYEGQPLFAEIDGFMRRNGFLLHRFVDVAGRTLRPFIAGGNRYRPISQILWADAVYIKDFTRLEKLSADLLLKTAVVLHDVYVSLDMVALVLQMYDAKAGTSLREAYLKRIATAPNLEYSFLNVKDWI
jgi:FkbM family methyltransferase